MIDLSQKNEWQHTCPETGLVLPWYTKSFLDELVTWDLKGKTVFEYGLGATSLWWIKKGCKHFGMESNDQWFTAVADSIGQESKFELQLDEKGYPQSIHQWVQDFDIVIIDGIERDECVKPALECLTPGGVLIIDNWMQPSVWIATEENQKLLLALEHKIYKQIGHEDWQTAVFIKPR
jgi:hypothetical protein